MKLLRFADASKIQKLLFGLDCGTGTTVRVTVLSIDMVELDGTV